jgi:hypothetical protein
LLRKVQLPEEYAQGLQGLLLKEQEDDRVTVDQSIEQKKVKIAESQAEAQKVRQIKHAEADARPDGSGGIRFHAIHAAAETKTNRAVAPRSRSAQANHH